MIHPTPAPTINLLLQEASNGARIRFQLYRDKTVRAKPYYLMFYSYTQHGHKFVIFYNDRIGYRITAKNKEHSMSEIVDFYKDISDLDIYSKVIGFLLEPICKTREQ